MNIELIVVDYANNIPDEMDTVIRKVVNFDGFSKDHQVKAFERLQEESELMPEKEIVIYTVNDHYKMMADEVKNNTDLIDVRTKGMDPQKAEDLAYEFLGKVLKGEIDILSDLVNYPIKSKEMPMVVSNILNILKAENEDKPHSWDYSISKISEWNIPYLDTLEPSGVLNSIVFFLTHDMYHLDRFVRKPVPSNTNNYTSMYFEGTPQFNRPEGGWKF